MNKKKSDLPQILILKRQYIQRFPNGQHVALYYSEHLNQFVTVPLDGSQFSSTTEAVVEKLQQISSSDNIQTILFDDLSELNINKECADVILNFISTNEITDDRLTISDKSFLELLEQAIQIVPEHTEIEEQQELIEQ